MEHLELARRLCRAMHYHQQLHGGAPCGEHMQQAGTYLALTDPRNTKALQVVIDAAHERGLRINPRGVVVRRPMVGQGGSYVLPEGSMLTFDEP